jgi:hypothetical protein
MATKTKARSKVRAREACVITVGARPIVWEKRIVRSNRTGKLQEIDVHELPVIDPGSEGIPYVFSKDDEAWDDHPAVKDSPSSFIPVDEPRSD